jgi:hypothetical protein
MAAVAVPLAGARTEERPAMSRLLRDGAVGQLQSSAGFERGKI